MGHRLTKGSRRQSSLENSTEKEIAKSPEDFQESIKSPEVKQLEEKRPYCLFISKLDEGANQKTLTDTFEKFKYSTVCEIIITPGNEQPAVIPPIVGNCAFVHFRSFREAKKAESDLQGYQIGRYKLDAFVMYCTDEEIDNYKGIHGSPDASRVVRREHGDSI